MEPNLERQNEGLEQYQSAIKFIEKSFLSSSPFLNGFDSPTIADLSAYAEVFFFFEIFLFVVLKDEVLFSWDHFGRKKDFKKPSKNLQK